MDSLRLFCDSLKSVVTVSCKCAEAKSECPTNWQDVAIVAVIAVAVCLVIYRICDTVKNIINMKKREGIKIILKDLIKEGCLKEETLANNE